MQRKRMFLPAALSWCFLSVALLMTACSTRPHFHDNLSLDRYRDYIIAKCHLHAPPDLISGQMIIGQRFDELMPAVDCLASAGWYEEYSEEETGKRVKVLENYANQGSARAMYFAGEVYEKVFGKDQDQRSSYDSKFLI